MSWTLIWMYLHRLQKQPQNFRQKNVNVKKHDDEERKNSILDRHANTIIERGVQGLRRWDTYPAILLPPNRTSIYIFTMSNWFFICLSRVSQNFMFLNVCVHYNAVFLKSFSQNTDTASLAEVFVLITNGWKVVIINQTPLETHFSNGCLSECLSGIYQNVQTLRLLDLHFNMKIHHGVQPITTDILYAV